MTSSLKTWWQGLKYWQKGGIVGFLVGFTFNFGGFFILSYLPHFDWLFEILVMSNFISRPIGDILFECVLCEGLYVKVGFVLLLGALQWTIIGTLIGLIIGKGK